MTNLVASASLLGILTFFGTAVSQVDSNTRIPLGEAIAVEVLFFLLVGNCRNWKIDLLP